MSYSRIFGSKFPTELIDFGKHKDVDDSTARTIEQYKEAVLTGNTQGAAILAEQLADYIIDSKYINRLEEEIYNVGLAAQSQYTVIVSDEEPSSDVDDGTYWVQEY